MRKFLSVLSIGILWANVGFASSACYTPAELHAEQMLRLHSELMVITVTCRLGSRGENLGSAYGSLTKKHIAVLHEAEQTLTHYFNAHGGNGQDALDRLRTKLGNEFGQKIADVSAPVYCGQYRDKVLSYRKASTDDVQNEVQRMVEVEPSFVPLCAGH